MGTFIDSHHHHHHVAQVARISLTLSRHSSLSFIALGRSSGQHPVSSHSCWMYVRAGRPAFARPCVGVHKSTSLMSSSLLLQQCQYTHETLVPFEVISSSCNTLVQIPKSSSRPHGSPLVWTCQWHSSQPLLSPQLYHNDNLWAWGISKSHREQGLD